MRIAIRYRTSPFHVTLLDVAANLILCTVVIGGSGELFQALPTSEPSRMDGGFAPGHAVAFDHPHARSREKSDSVRYTFIGESAFTSRWLWRFSIMLVAGILLVMLSHFVAAWLQRWTRNPRPFLPRMVAAIACMLFLAAQFVWVYSVQPNTYSQVDGRHVHVATSAGWQALCVVALGVPMMAFVELFQLFSPHRENAEVVIVPRRTGVDL